MNNTNNILQKTFGSESRWVNYRLIQKDGKMTKVPYSPVTKTPASSINEAGWDTYEASKKVSKDIGIVFKPDQMLLGIDIDHCIEGGRIVHEDKDKIALLLAKADTYTELSPSGTGLHIIIKLSEPMKLLANKKAPFECYTAGRYFTVTEKAYGIPKEVRTMTKEEAVSLLGITGYPWGKEVSVNVEKIKSKLTAPAIPIDDADLLKKMFSSANGVKVKALYDGDISQNNNDDSSADMALCSHLAFWTKKDPVQIERMWMESPLGQRQKTQNREDYRKRTIENAIAKCTQAHETKMEKVLTAIKEEGEELNLMWSYDRQKNVVFTQNTENICRVLREHKKFKDTLRYDEFKNTLEYFQKGKWKNLEDHHAIDIQTEISILFPCFAKVGKDMVFDAMMKVSQENKIDSAVDYLKSLKWDGVARLDSWLFNTYGVEDDIKNQKIGSNWMKGLVKRLIHPGCKFDYVLVLEGEQGTKKSTSLGILGGSWHCETTMSMDNKDFFMQFQGKAIIEFSEGETLSRTDVKKMKAIITTASDKYRPAYGRVSMDFPRRCVFAMTTNQTEYLKDETGNRRWLPVACQGDANIKWLKENRDQLFAETYQRVIVKDETTHEFPEEEMVLAQNQRMIHDPNEELVTDWYWNKLTQSQRNDGVTVHQAHKDVFHGTFGGKALDRWVEMSIAGILKNIIDLDKRRTMISGTRYYKYYPKGAPKIMMTIEPEKKEDKIRQLSLNEEDPF